jgi:phosphatidylserine/phosphatidylglycerophosphate/cardiolipin synthase-like enzyme
VNASVTTAQAHTGSYSDLNGSVSKPEIDGNAGLCQEFVVPAGGTLTFWVYEGTSETSTEYSYQEVDLLSAGARTSTVVAQLDKEVTTTSGWVQRTYSLSAYAGKTVWLYFGVHANGYSSGYIYQYIDDVSVSGTATPTPSPSASPTKTPSPTPSPTKTPSPTPSPTKTPSPTPSPSTSPTKSPAPGNPCTQAQGTGQSSSVSVVAYTTVTGAIASGHEVCLSAYVFTTAMFDALQTAAKNGAKVTVVLPQEEKSTDSSDATALQTAGATIVWDPGSPTDHPLHAKLALVDGVAYLDGRNWDTNDVTITDGVAADYTAITNALNLNPTSSTNLDTLKSNSIAREDAFITGAAPGKGVTVQFMSESFGTDTATNTALENAAKAGATVEVMVLSSDESGNSTEEAVLNTLKADGAQVRLNPASGSEKIALIGGQSTAWFGSANATDSTTSTDNYIDWGMTVTNASVVSSLQSYFNTTWATGTAF